MSSHLPLPISPVQTPGTGRGNGQGDGIKKFTELSERNEAGAQAREFWRRAIDSVVAGEAAKAEHQAQVLDKIEFVAFVDKFAVRSQIRHLDFVRLAAAGVGFVKIIGR